MPFYEYECQACHRVTEVLQKMSDPPLGKCPSCGKDKLQKLISASAFRLSGGGWYETDFKSDAEGKRNLAGAEKEEAKVEAKSETKTDGKGDGKTESTPAPKEKPAAAPATPPAAKRKVAAPARTAARSTATPHKPAAKAKAAAKPKAKPKAPARKR
jgi:putative FmdB family regulatory protein